MSDQDRISPYNIKTKSRGQVMRKKKNMNKGIIRWSNMKLSELNRKNCKADIKENYWWDLGS